MQDELKIDGEGSTKNEKSDAKRLNYIVFKSKYCTSSALSLLFKYLVWYYNDDNDDDDDDDDDDAHSL